MLIDINQNLQTRDYRLFLCKPTKEIVGEIYDFENDGYDDIVIPESVKKHGIIISKRVVLEGICSKCKRE